MRMSASGLLSTIAVAIDQIFLLAPSIRPPIEPVVSSTNATSTVGFALAAENAAIDSNAAVAKASARKTMADFIGILQCSVPRNQSSLRFKFPGGRKQGGRGTNLRSLWRGCRF